MKMSRSRFGISSRICTRFRRYFGWKWRNAISFFSTCRIVHRTLSSKDIGKNPFFQVFENLPKHLPDTNSEHKFTDFISRNVIFWIRGQNENSYLFHLSKHNLDPIWMILMGLKMLHFHWFFVFFYNIFRLFCTSIFTPFSYISKDIGVELTIGFFC